MSIAEKLLKIASQMQEAYDKAKSVYDDFWDNYQDYGNRTDYERAFADNGFNDKSYNPKYPMTVSKCSKMFAENTQITDTKVPLVFTEVGDDKYFFVFTNCTSLKRIPSIEAVKGFYWETVFENCSSLEYVGVRGKIYSTIDVTYSPNLNAETVMNFVAALEDYTGTEDEYSYSMLFSSETYEKGYFNILMDNRCPEYEGQSLLDIIMLKSWNF